jgi:hypothetical protein
VQLRRPIPASVGSPDANSSAPIPTTTAPSGTTLRGPNWSMADAGHQTKGRVAVVEQADERGDARGCKAEGVRQLRHHYGLRRPLDLQVEIENRRDQPCQRNGDERPAPFAPLLATSAPQQSVTDTARPPSDVSLDFEFISFAVSAMASTTLSKSTRLCDAPSCAPHRYACPCGNCRAIRAGAGFPFGIAGLVDRQPQPETSLRHLPPHHGVVLADAAGEHDRVQPAQRIALYKGLGGGWHATDAEWLQPQ